MPSATCFGAGTCATRSSPDPRLLSILATNARRPAAWSAAGRLALPLRRPYEAVFRLTTVTLREVGYFRE
ncbi:MAG: hypothetical protein AMXMBFR55_33760 [Gemmatimonadota bacterium]